MITVGSIKYYRIPDYFVERYDADLAAWANLRPFPSTRLITFREGAFAKDSPDPEQGKELLGAWLLARISRKGVEIEPLSKRDEDRIRAHCANMQFRGVPALARLVEPERPGLPVIPRLN